MEVHMSNVARFSVMAMVGVATAALACRDTTTPREASTAGITKPSFTAAAGFTPTVLARGNLGTFHIQSKAGTYDDSPTPDLYLSLVEQSCVPPPHCQPSPSPACGLAPRIPIS